MAVPAAIGLVTLGVRDIAASTAFYEALGFPSSSSSVPGEVSFFPTAGAGLAVWRADALREDSRSGGSDAGFRAVALAINVASPEAVDEALATAERAGATLPRAAGPTDWGGYQGYFADPDGHLWEVAHNPFWPLTADGTPQIPT